MDSFAASLSSFFPIAKQSFAPQAHGSLGYIVPSPTGICVHTASSLLVKTKTKTKQIKNLLRNTNSNFIIFISSILLKAGKDHDEYIEY